MSREPQFSLGDPGDELATRAANEALGVAARYVRENGREVERVVVVVDIKRIAGESDDTFGRGLGVKTTDPDDATPVGVAAILIGHAKAALEATGRNVHLPTLIDAVRRRN